MRKVVCFRRERPTQSRVDSFKIDVGLPPELPVEISDPVLDRFILIDPGLTELQNELNEILFQLRKSRDQPTLDLTELSLQKLTDLDARIDQKDGRGVGRPGGARSNVCPSVSDSCVTWLRQIRELTRMWTGGFMTRRSCLSGLSFLKQRLPSIATSLRESKEQRQAIAAEGRPTDPQQAWTGNRRSCHQTIGSAVGVVFDSGGDATPGHQSVADRN